MNKVNRKTNKTQKTIQQNTIFANKFAQNFSFVCLIKDKIINLKNTNMAYKNDLNYSVDFQ